MYVNVGSEVKEIPTGEFGEETGTAIFYWVEVVDKTSGVVYFHERMFRTDNDIDEVPALCSRLFTQVEEALVDGTLTRDHLERSKRWTVGELTYRHLSYSNGETEGRMKHFEWETRVGLREPVNPFPW